MKYFKLLTICLLATWMVSSCGGKKGGDASENDSDSISAINMMPKDKTLYGICGEGTAMNTLQLITDNGDTLNISILLARDNNMVFGGLEENNKMAVLLAPDSSAVEVINLSTLLGNWVEPNPLDGSSIQGIAIKDGGIAQSINMSNMIYKSWRIFNGRFVVTFQSDIASQDEEETDTFDIKSLGADSLSIGNSNETHQYNRQR